MYYIEHKNNIIIPACEAMKIYEKKVLLNQKSSYGQYFWLEKYFFYIDDFYGVKPKEYLKKDSCELEYKRLYNLFINKQFIFRFFKLEFVQTTWEEFLKTCYGDTGNFEDYKLLGVNVDDDINTIKKVFKKLSLIYHPDIKETGNEEHYRKILNSYNKILKGK